MLAFARSRLDHAGIRNCSVRQGDIFDLAVPRNSFDVVIIHQVLHFLDDGGRAIREAARLLRPNGRLLVVDFAPHTQEFLRDEHAHRKLGFAPETVTHWLEQAGLEGVVHTSLSPEAELRRPDRGLVVARSRSPHGHRRRTRGGMMVTVGWSWPMNTTN